MLDRRGPPSNSHYFLNYLTVGASRDVDEIFFLSKLLAPTRPRYVQHHQTIVEDISSTIRL